ncbi:MAG: rhomboid family intramembrane serine protease [Polyangiaceae bacterium]
MRVPHFHRGEVVAIVVFLTLVWGYDQSLGPVGSMLFDDRYGAVPARLWAAWHDLRHGGFSREVLAAALPLLTASFLHASFGHLAANMLFFWVFGNAVSEAAGRAAFLGLYVLAGIVAVLVYVRTNPGSEIPMVGASGAIAGLEGAYFALAYRWELPHAHVWPLEGPVAPWRLGVLAIVNFFLDTQAFFEKSDDRTAYGAHVGGFLGGALLAMALASVWRPVWRRA